jgi:hypothetical protein
MGRNWSFINIVLVLSSCALMVQCEYDCEYKKDGFYSDEDFCHIYWRCNYGVAEEYECPAGTAWNHVEKRCDWLDNVDCSRVDIESQQKKEDDDDAKEIEELYESIDAETDNKNNNKNNKPSKKEKAKDDKSKDEGKHF